MNRSEQINEIAAALSKAQAEVRGAVRDSDNFSLDADRSS